MCSVQGRKGTCSMRAHARVTLTRRHAGIVTGQLRLDAGTLSAIYQCSIVSWDDPAITALNPNLS